MQNFIIVNKLYCKFLNILKCFEKPLYNIRLITQYLANFIKQLAIKNFYLKQELSLTTTDLKIFHK